MSIMEDDRGYLYGDALFETMRVRDGDVIWLERHQARMHRSAIALGFSSARIDEAFEQVERAVKRGQSDGLCRVTVSREPTPDVAFGGRGSISLRWRALPASAGALSLGIEPGFYHPEDEIAEHKTSNYLRSVMARQRACERGFDDALRVTRGGRIGECSASNVFFVMTSGEVVTPVVEGLLPGVMRGMICEVLKEQGMEVEEREVHRDELMYVEGCWASSMGMGVRAIERIERHDFESHPMMKSLLGWLVVRGWR